MIIMKTHPSQETSLYYERDPKACVYRGGTWLREKAVPGAILVSMGFGVRKLFPGKTPFECGFLCDRTLEYRDVIFVLGINDRHVPGRTDIWEMVDFFVNGDFTQAYTADNSNFANCTLTFETYLKRKEEDRIRKEKYEKEEEKRKEENKRKCR